ncbi:molybdate ABC transporter permease subunit [Caulobacter sp. NIBR2454]|uniref:molybdate ABC transporter permease subunit n=1 Tax=Caulobacter sp. NIBR2454 TaxID=3015996 RepID=UPI0022B60061|nr:molybdate ABC transporter permease subunit [Caulobacter sp. NIBR2454]
MEPGDLAILFLSLKVAAVAAVAGLPPAILAAWALARGRFPGRNLLDAALHLPLVIPPVATGFVLLVLFGRRGLLGPALEKVGIVFAFDWTGAALAAGIMAFPLMVRPIRLSIEAIDAEVEEAARTLGAGRVARFVRILLPLSAPGIGAGLVLGFARALGEFGATITFVAAIPGETLTLPAAIYAAVQTPGGETRAAILCAASAVLAVAAVLAADQVGRAASRFR